LGRKYLNSILVLVATLAIVIPAVCCAAYAIARTDFRFKKGIYFYLLLGLCIPTGVLAIPIFSVALKYKLVNSYWGVILFGAAQCMAFGVFLLRSFFISLPKSLEEAAMIDGCTPLQTFFRIVMPILKPTCITVAILQAMWIWNDYLLPYLVLDMTKYKTIPIAVQYLRGGYGSIDMGAMMGVLVLAIIPIIIFYLACQRYIIEGVVAGAVKG
jgi:raffinose/stachyose/melibiose transport system permease protein